METSSDDEKGINPFLIYLVTSIGYTALGISVANELPFLVEEVLLQPSVAGYWIAAASGTSAIATLLFGKFFPQGVYFRGWAFLLFSQGAVAFILGVFDNFSRLLMWLVFASLIPVTQSAAVTAISSAGIKDIVAVRAKIRVIVNLSMAVGSLAWTLLRSSALKPVDLYMIASIIFIISGFICLFALGMKSSKKISHFQAMRSVNKGKISRKAIFYVASFFPIYCIGSVLSFGVPFVIEESDTVNLDKIGILFSVNMIMVVLFQVPFSRLIENTKLSRFIPGFIVLILMLSVATIYGFRFFGWGIIGIISCVILISLVEIVGSNLDFSVFYQIVNEENLGVVSSLRSSVEISAQVAVPIIFPLIIWLSPWTFFLLFTLLLSAWGILFISSKKVYSQNSLVEMNREKV